MPRVVVLTAYYHPVIGGVESNAGRLAGYLQSHGVPVQVVTKRISADLPDEDSVHAVPVRRIGPRGTRSAAGKWALVPAALTWLIRHRAEYDAVCAVDYRGVGVAAILARAFTRHPVVFQAQTAGVLTARHAAVPARVSGLAEENPLTRLAKWPARRLYRWADAFACISHGLEQETLATGIPREKVHFVPNAIDMRRFSPSPEARTAQRAALGIASETVVCLFLGRLSREKGLLDLVEAWRLLDRTGALLLVVGPETTGHAWNAAPAARERVERYGLADSVRFLGPAANVPPLLRAADIVVQPSHFEALGLSAVEALACGVPVVASDVGGLTDFVVDGQNGRLVPPANPAALATALEGLIKDAGVRDRLACAARDSVHEYDESLVFSRLRALIASLVEDRQRAP